MRRMEMLMKIGFTGAASGMTDAQWDATQWLLRCMLMLADDEPVIARHNNGAGADHDFDRICSAMKIPVEYGRINDAVGSVDVVIACPPTHEPIQRGSGSWARIKCAKQQEKPLHMCYPSGELEHINALNVIVEALQW